MATQLDDHVAGGAADQLSKIDPTAATPSPMAMTFQLRMPISVGADVAGRFYDPRMATGEEPTTEAPRERDPARLVAFSDGVIAIAITLLVLEIRPPEDTRDLLHGLLALWPSYLAYILTFMLIGQIWANHHVMFDHIRHADRAVLFLNTVLLMDIAFLPFAASVLAGAFRDGHGERTAVVLHGVVFLLAAVLFNIIWAYVRRRQRPLLRNLDAAGTRAIGRRFRLALGWLGGGTLLGAFVPAAGVAVIAAFNVFYWLPISGELGWTRPR